MRQVFDLIILFLISGFAFAAEKPADYAFGLPLEASGTEALYEVTLPATVYQGVTRRDLGDVRVFNGAGEVVPHALRARRTDKADAGAQVALTLFALKAAAGANLDGLSINVRRGVSGAVSVDVKSPGAQAPAQDVVGYLIDLSAQERALRAIELEWTALAGFSGRLRVDASDDLSMWRTLVAAAPLLNLEVGGQRLQQKRIELPQVKAKYLRLAWVSDDKNARAELTAASGELAAKMVEAAREWQQFAAAKGAKAGEYIFDLKGLFPVDRLRLELPDANTIAQIEVLVRDQAEQPWRSVTRGVAYRLNRPGGEVVSPEIQVGAASERWWMIRVDQRGGGIGSGMPTLNAGWVPHQLVFAARGAAPFTLAYGNRQVQPGALPIASLIPGYREDTISTVPAAKASAAPTLNVQAAAAQGQKDLGGVVRLKEQVDWKRWTLWGVLGLGVMILGVMAFRLMKQLGATEGARMKDER
ncbi:MAG: DUF3999 domain-containing protein [Betaproteobacteria bacterium]|nr:DUF3999 domain-containing protein [Betaproteobacteria bacterium]